MSLLRRLYPVLDHPAVYRLSQLVFAPGQQTLLGRRIGGLLKSLPPGAKILDIGCGPRSWLLPWGVPFVGLDLSPQYVAELRGRGAPGVVGSAAELPFADASFDGVFSVGLFHHLPDAIAGHVIREAARVCRREKGALVLLDAVVPRSPWRRPVAHWIRRADRGRFMRTEDELRSLLPPDYQWQTERFTYTLTGMEVLACVSRFDPR